jgi:hypothetical protein
MHKIKFYKIYIQTGEDNAKKSTALAWVIGVASVLILIALYESWFPYYAPDDEKGGTWVIEKTDGSAINTVEKTRFVSIIDRQSAKFIPHIREIEYEVKILRMMECRFGLD